MLKKLFFTALYKLIQLWKRYSLERWARQQLVPAALNPHAPYVQLDREENLVRYALPSVALTVQLLGDEDRFHVCRSLIGVGRFDEALQISETISAIQYQTIALAEVARAQIETGTTTEARLTLGLLVSSLKDITRSDDRRAVLEEVRERLEDSLFALSQAATSPTTEIESIAGSETVLDIDGENERPFLATSLVFSDDNWSIKWFEDLAQKVAAGDDLGTLLSNGRIQRPLGSPLLQRVFDLVAIAKMPLRSKNQSFPMKTLLMALKITGEINDPETQAEAFVKVAETYAELDDLIQARHLLLMARDTAAQVVDEEKRADVLHDIAKAQLRNGDDDVARDTLAMTLNSNPHSLLEEQIKALCVVAQGQATQGADEASRVSLSRAFVIAHSIEDHQKRDASLCQLAQVQAQLGNVQAAWAVAQEIGEDAMRDTALSTLGSEQVKAGDIAGAFDMCQAISSADRQALPLNQIAKAQAKLGDLEASQQTFAAAILAAQANLTEDKEVKIIDAGLIRYTAFPTKEVGQVVTLATIASSQAEVHDIASAHCTFAIALSTISRIQDDFGRVAALRDIAELQFQSVGFSQAQKTLNAALNVAHKLPASHQGIALQLVVSVMIKMGDMEHAIKTALIIRDRDARAWAFEEIAEAQANARDIEMALEAVRQIPDRNDAERALERIANVRAAQGDIDGAVKMAYDLQNPTLRSSALNAIALACAQAGRWAQAAEIADEIFFDRDAYLPTLAQAMVKAADHQYFKHIVFACRYNIDAAYKIAALLALAYPEEAGAVAEIIASH